jgi:hypothetical protein
MMHGSLRPGSSCGTTAASVHSAPLLLLLRRRFILWAGLHDFARGVQTRRYRLAWGAVTSLESTMVHVYFVARTATAADVADSAFFFSFGGRRVVVGRSQQARATSLNVEHPRL